MPRNALKRDHVDHVLPLVGIGGLLAAGAGKPAPSIPLPDEYASRTSMAAQEFAVMEADIVTPGQPSHISCPDCGGVLNQIDAGQTRSASAARSAMPLPR
jgi:two-component system chemotaxis response regulator CheB